MRGKLWGCIVWAALVLALPIVVGAAQASEQRFGQVTEQAPGQAHGQARILALTDFHGRIEERGADVGLPKLLTAVKEHRARHADTVLVAVGDLFTGSVESDLLQGRPVLEGLLAAGLSLSALGNHEFDWNPGDISRWNAAGLPFVCANVRVGAGREVGHAPRGVQPFALRTAGGIRTAFVGLITQDTPRSVTAGNTGGLTFLPPLDVLPGAVRAARQAGAEAVIVLAHLAEPHPQSGQADVGPEVRQLGRVPGVTAVIFGHSHEQHLGEERGPAGERVPLVQPAPYGQGLAVLHLERDGHGVVRATATLDKLTQRKATLAEDAQGRALVRQARADVGPELEKSVAHLDAGMAHEDSQPSPLGELVCDALRWQTGAEAALVNGGGIRGSLEAGPVRRRDLYRILPFNNTLVAMTLTGAEMARILERSLDNGKLRCIQLSGVHALYDASLPPGQRVALHRADGSVVRAEDTVRVTTNSFLAGGGDGVFLPGMGTDRQSVEMNEREALRSYLQHEIPATQNGKVERLPLAARPWLTVKRQ